MPNNDVILRFNKVSFEYGKKVILKEADFSIRRGSKITLMGQNGAGKSTILQMITGRFVPHEGMITIENGLTMATARQVIPRAELGLTIREFFESVFPNKVYDIEPRIRKILAVVHLQASQNTILKELSGGQQARLLLAQALIQDPDLLLLDEPTNGLDPRTQCFLVELILALNEAGKTIVIATHDLSLVSELRCRVAVLSEEHTIERVGDADDILNDERLLLKVNLIHEHVHYHGEIAHRHIHSHYLFHRHEGGKGGGPDGNLHTNADTNMIK